MSGVREEEKGGTYTTGKKSVVEFVVVEFVIAGPEINAAALVVP